MFSLRPIGIIRSPFSEKDTPVQPTCSQAIGMVEVYPEFADGVDGLDGFSRIILSDSYALRVQTFLADRFHEVLPPVIFIPRSDS